MSVAEIAKILDEKEPDWFNKINIEELDLSQAKKCILGQIYGSYWSEEARNSINQFRFNRELDNNYYKHEWIGEIKQRRNLIMKNQCPPVIYEYEPGLWDANCGPKDRCKLEEVVEQVQRFCDNQKINRIIVVPLNGNVYTIEKSIWAVVRK